MYKILIILITILCLYACNLFKAPSDLYVGTYTGSARHHGLILVPINGAAQIVEDTNFSAVFQFNKIDEKTLEIVGSGEIVTAKRNEINKTYHRTETGQSIQNDTTYQFKANRADKDSLYAYETYIITAIDLSSLDTIYKSHLTTEWHVKK